MYLEGKRTSGLNSSETGQRSIGCKAAGGGRPTLCLVYCPTWDSHLVISAALNQRAEALDCGESPQFQRFLAAMGRFHGYSSRNLLLILRPQPRAGMSPEFTPSGRWDAQSATVNKASSSWQLSPVANKQPPRMGTNRCSVTAQQRDYSRRVQKPSRGEIRVISVGCIDFRSRSAQENSCKSQHLISEKSGASSCPTVRADQSAELLVTHDHTIGIS